MTQTSTVAVVTVALLWVAYFAAHSLLASLGMKHWVARTWPGSMAWYRLAFNALAMVLVLPPLWFTLTWPGPMLWQWTGTGAWLANGLGAAAVAGFLWSLRHYDGKEFLGLRQWRRREHSPHDQETLHISPLHRFVRHPWYFLGLVILWTRDMDLARLVAAALATGYLVVGSWLEEAKLRVYHGETYRRYMARVPGLVPRPWRFLTRAEAAALTASAPPSRAHRPQE